VKSDTVPTTENSGLSKCAISFGISLALASLVNGLLVIAKERIPAVMTGMQKLTGHHWITHSEIVIGIFLLFGFVLTKTGIKMTTGGLIRMLLAGIATGVLLILGFYLIGD
jgi:hypothetical protein